MALLYFKKYWNGLTTEQQTDLAKSLDATVRETHEQDAPRWEYQIKIKNITPTAIRAIRQLGLVPLLE